MTDIQGTELQRGDAVIYKIGKQLIAGNIHQFYDRNKTLRISGYNLQVEASDVLFAGSAWDTVTGPIFAKREAEAKAAAEKKLAEEEAAKHPKPPAPPLTEPPKPEASHPR